MRTLGLCLTAFAVLVPIVLLAADEPTQVFLDDGLGRRYQLTINRANADIAACYTAQLTKKPGLAGRLDLRVTVEASGKARSVEVRKDTLGSADAVKCIQDLLMQKTWPTNPTPVYFDTLFDFSPEKK
jgi:hypothetical protein